jgi:DNA repair exonuclease SbcCD ATPase subunit
MKIVKLQAENIKRLKAVEVTPSGDLVVVGGKNDAGKSSLLDAIEMALGGRGQAPPRPVRQGASKAKVVVDLGDLIVTRTFTENGGGQLVVENKDGARFRSPQAMLDKLYGSLAFDPLAFEQLEPKAQAETLRQLVGLDTTDLDQKRQIIYDERTNTNREINALQVTVDTLVCYPDAPEAEVSIAELADELEYAEAQRAVAQTADEKVAVAEHLVKVYGVEISGVEGTIRELQQRIANAQDKLEALLANLYNAQQQLGTAETEAQQAHQNVPALDEIHSRIKEAEGLNLKVRTNRRHAQAAQALTDAREYAASLTRQLTAVDQAKADRLKATVFPVDGLGVDTDGVTWRGLPFEQASTSERLRVSVAIGMAANPTLRVLLVRDGSLLGQQKLALLAQMAKDADCQVWLELLQETPDGRTTVFIEDGSVVSAGVA